MSKSADLAALIRSRAGKQALLTSRITQSNCPVAASMPKMQAVADTTPIDKKLFCYSCVSDQPKDYVQDRMRREAARLGPLLNEANTHMVICGLNGMESGVEAALANICRSHGLDWNVLKPEMRLGGITTSRHINWARPSIA